MLAPDCIHRSSVALCPGVRTLFKPRRISQEPKSLEIDRFLRGTVRPKLLGQGQAISFASVQRDLEFTPSVGNLDWN